MDIDLTELVDFKTIDITELRREAGRKNNPDAQYLMVLLNSGGYGRIPVSLYRARKWAEKGAKEKHPFCLANHILFSRRSKGDPIGISEHDLMDHEPFMYEWMAQQLEQEAQKKSPYAQYILGQLYRTGTVVEKDEDKALSYYFQSARQGYATAQFVLGVLVANGFGYFKRYDKPKREKETLEWVRLAAEQNYADALLLVYNAYNKVAHQWLERLTEVQKQIGRPVRGISFYMQKNGTLASIKP